MAARQYPRMRLKPIKTACLALALASVAIPALAEPPAGKPEIDPQAKRITGSENYIATFGLRASISHGYRVSGVMAVDAGLDVPSPKGRKRVDALKPRIMSEMRDAVLTYASLSYVDGQKPDADMLEIRLQKAVDGVLGPGEARVALASVIVYAK
jgi:hypothetical protein